MNKRQGAPMKKAQKKRQARSMSSAPTTSLQKARRARAKLTAEIFTPHFLVNQILDKLPKEAWEQGKTFVDPACGNGNMLIHVLYRKIAIHDQDPTEALQSIYGVDIMRDNIRECHERLLAVIALCTCAPPTSDMREALRTNVIWLNQERYPRGSLDYDFAFDGNHNRKRATT